MLVQYLSVAASVSVSWTMEKMSHSKEHLMMEQMQMLQALGAAAGSAQLREERKK
jgi:hypothetical protein